MLPQKFDTTIAHKIVNLMPELTGTDKRVAAAIIEHFNRKTGQCDPGLDRIARLIGVSRRTAIRSVSRVVGAGVFHVVRHGGRSQRNSYEPVWLRFRELDALWRARFRGESPSAGGSKTSPENSQICHVPRDEPDTQTFLTNQSKETRSEAPSSAEEQPSERLDRKGQPIKEEHSHEPRAVRSGSTNGSQVSLAAHTAAERLWNRELLQRYSATPNVYAAIIDAITPELQREATEAEMHKRGAGIALILEQLQLRGEPSPANTDTTEDNSKSKMSCVGANHESCGEQHHANQATNIPTARLEADS
jgi:Helix-turn-helix domain